MISENGEELIVSKRIVMSGENLLTLNLVLTINQINP